MKYGLLYYRKKIGEELKPVGVIGIVNNHFYYSIKEKHSEFKDKFEHFGTTKRIFVPLKYSPNDKPTALKYYQFLRDTNIALYKLSDLKDVKTNSPNKSIKKIFEELS